MDERNFGNNSRPTGSRSSHGPSLSRGSSNPSLTRGASGRSVGTGVVKAGAAGDGRKTSAREKRSAQKPRKEKGFPFFGKKKKTVEEIYPSDLDTNNARSAMPENRTVRTAPSNNGFDMDPSFGTTASFGADTSFETDPAYNTVPSMGAAPAFDTNVAADADAFSFDLGVNPATPDDSMQAADISAESDISLEDVSDQIPGTGFVMYEDSELIGGDFSIGGQSAEPLVVTPSPSETYAASGEPAFEEAEAKEAPAFEEAEAKEAPAFEEAEAKEAPVFEEAEAKEAPVFEEAEAKEAPVSVEGSAVDEEPEAIEEPAVDEEPAVIEEPAVDEEPAVFEESAVDEEPAVFEEPGDIEEPAAFEEGGIGEEPVIAEETEAAEEMAAEEDSPAEQDNAAEEESETAQEPVPEEIPVTEEETKTEEPVLETVPETAEPVAEIPAAAAPAAAGPAVADASLAFDPDYLRNLPIFSNQKPIARTVTPTALDPEKAEILERADSRGSAERARNAARRERIERSRTVSRREKPQRYPRKEEAYEKPDRRSRRERDTYYEEPSYTQDPVANTPAYGGQNTQSMPFMTPFQPETPSAGQPASPFGAGMMNGGFQQNTVNSQTGIRHAGTPDPDRPLRERARDNSRNMAQEERRLRDQSHNRRSTDSLVFGIIPRASMSLIFLVVLIIVTGVFSVIKLEVTIPVLIVIMILEVVMGLFLAQMPSFVSILVAAGLTFAGALTGFLIPVCIGNAVMLSAGLVIKGE